MSKILPCVFVIAIACLMVVGPLSAEDAAKPSELVWVGLNLLLPDGETTEYLIGTMEKEILDQIELGTYDRHFVRLSNLRIQSDSKSESAEAGAEARPVYLDCADEYDRGIILVRYEDVLSIEFKKGDPLEVN